MPIMGEDGEEQESYGSDPSLLPPAGYGPCQAGSESRAEDIRSSPQPCTGYKTWLEIPPFGWRPEFES